MEKNCERCGQIASAGRTLKMKAASLESSPDKGSPRYLDTKGTIEARIRELELAASDHEADVHYLDLLVMCSDALALMPPPKPPPF